MRKTKLVIIENDEDERIFMKEGFEETGFFEIVALFQNGDELIRFLENENENRNKDLNKKNLAHSLKSRLILKSPFLPEPL